VVTLLDISRTKEEHAELPGSVEMSEAVPSPQDDRYERACDQAIAMCDGNLRSTIRALIMANEYLEGELQALQAEALACPAPARSPLATDDAA
jgi:hypothetical protein